MLGNKRSNPEINQESQSNSIIEEANNTNKSNNNLQLNTKASNLSTDNNLRSFERNCSVFLHLITSVLPNNDEVDETQEKCICTPIDTTKDEYFEEKEIIPEIILTATADNKIQLFNLIMILKQYGYPLTASLIYFYHTDSETFIACGSDPLEQNIYLPLGSSDDNNIYTINLRCYSFLDEDFVKKITSSNLTNSDMNNMNDGNKTINDDKTGTNKANIKRTKERKIGFIIEKVNAWRKLYNGFYDENKNFIKYSLEDAANIIGISKKSLDDYLLQLRLGRKFGFDFNENRHAKVGVLRTYVKNQRAKKDTINYKEEMEDNS